MNAHAVAASLLFILVASSHAQTLSGEVGSATFRKLGFGNVTLASGNESQVLRFDLPENVSQGPEKWVVVHLDLLVKFNGSALRETPGAASYVSGSTNGRAFASVKFDALEVNGSLRVRWDFVNVTGVFRDTVAPGDLRLSLSNYPQFQGVRPGRNEMELRLEDPAGLVERAIVEEGSAIEVTERSPPKLRLTSVNAPGEVREGKPFYVSAVLENLGGLAVKNSQVSVQYSKGPVELRGENTTLRFDWIEARESVNWTFRARGGGAATLRLLVRSESADSSPTAELTITVRPKENLWALPVGLAAAALAAGYLLLRMRGRS